MPLPCMQDVYTFLLAGCTFLLVPRKHVQAIFMATIIIQAAPASRGRHSTMNHVLVTALSATPAEDSLVLQGACLLLAVPQIFRKSGESILGRQSARDLRVATGPAMVYLLWLDAVQAAAPVQTVLACLFSMAAIMAPAADWPQPPHSGARVHGLLCRGSTCVLLAAFAAQAGSALMQPALALLLPQGHN
jgi:hypothetical protein